MPHDTASLETVLPGELVASIQDMACRKIHNDAPSRFGLIVVVDVACSSKIEGSFERRLEEWAWDSLDRAHQAVDARAQWHFVSNVLIDQFDDTDDDQYRQNQYQICVHIEPPTAYRKSNGLFCYSPEHSDWAKNPVHPARVLEHFATPPAEVRGVAVSGVSQTIIRDEWADCIAKCSEQFDRDGKGFMLHPMWTLPAMNSGNAALPRLFTRREMSFNFGWPSYPGGRGNDW